MNFNCLLIIYTDFMLDHCGRSDLVTCRVLLGLWIINLQYKTKLKGPFDAIGYLNSFIGLLKSILNFLV